MSGARVLVVDDDPAILRAVRQALGAHGFDVHTLEGGSTLAAAVTGIRPEVIILDLVLPDADGIELCRQVRRTSKVPVIVLSAVGDDAKKVQALNEGADDYVTKPFSMSELEARIRVNLRRQANIAASSVLTCGDISLDVATHLVTVAGELVHLTPHEFELLRLLLQNQGRVLTHRQILSAVWGPEYVDDTHILRTFVHQLRTKLAARSPRSAEALVTDPGVGYRFLATKS